MPPSPSAYSAASCQADVETEQAAASLGMTAEEFERTYAHASPDFQQAAANVF